MKTHSVVLFTFLLLSITDLARADDKAIATRQASVSPDKAFSDQLTKDKDELGVDWSPWTGLAAIEDSEDTPTAGKTFVSPDHRFSVQTTVADREFEVVINDAQARSISRLPFDYCPIFSLEWSPDSKTILTVGHLSMTSLIVLLHWNGKRWMQFDIDPTESEDNDKFHVVKWEFNPNDIKATYIVNHRTDTGRSIDLYRCTFHIDPTNGDISDMINKAITQETYLALRTSRN